jgi:hypothetical protein
MSTIGGAFTIVNNDGIQDKLIMATDKLRNILKHIGCLRLIEMRRENPELSDQELLAKDTSWMPSLATIEQSHILFVNSTFKPFVSIASEYSKNYVKGGVLPELGNRAVFTLPIYGEFVNDMVLNVKFNSIQSYHAQDKVRYYEMLGHRLLKKTTFSIGNQILDSYTNEKYNIHYQYNVTSDKESSYLKCIGQETPKLGYLTADPLVDEVREYKYFGDGNQTFKTVQPQVELWIPLLFWFKDIKNSFPNFLINYGQTNIEIDLESADKLITNANYSGSPEPLHNELKLTECSLYINHIFLLPEIYKIFTAKFGFQLIRVTLQNNFTLIKHNDNILLHTVKWPVESLYFGFRPKNNDDHSQKWYRNSIITERTIKQPVIVGNDEVQVNEAQFIVEDHVIDNIQLKAHDVSLFPKTSAKFYSDYMPYAYNVRTPKDLGWYALHFARKPGDQQPSGHFNTSQNRELVLSYESAINPLTNTTYINSTNPVEFYVCAECINFLLINNNTATLRFAT